MNFNEDLVSGKLATSPKQFFRLAFVVRKCFKWNFFPSGTCLILADGRALHDFEHDTNSY